MCVTDRHDMTLVVKVALNHNKTNQLPEYLNLQYQLTYPNDFVKLVHHCVMYSMFVMLLSSEILFRFQKFNVAVAS